MHVLTLKSSACIRPQGVRYVSELSRVQTRLHCALPNASRRLGSRFPNSESCPSLQQTLLPRSGAAERREDLTPYWRVLSQGCGLRIPSLGYGEFFCVSWRAVRNLESRRFLWAFFHAPGTLRLDRIDREQVRPRNGRVGRGLRGRGRGRSLPRTL